MGVHPPSDGTASDRTYHRARAARKTAFGAAIVVAASVVLARRRAFRVEVQGGSMRPTLEPGDWLVGVRVPRIRRGDVVVLEHPARPGVEIVKRVIALGGEAAPGGGILDAGEVWVEGDAPDGSTDSRRFGPVAAGAIRGRAWAIYAPPGRRRRL
jgi:nickel-type superoxide dismutase maturation protease